MLVDFYYEKGIPVYVYDCATDTIGQEPSPRWWRGRRRGQRLPP